MRRGASIFLRADGRWEARYQKARDENGKVKYGYVYGSTQEEAEAKRKTALVALNKSSLFSISPLPSVNPRAETMPLTGRRSAVRVSERMEAALTTEEVAILDACLENSSEPAAVGLYLCLHAGLSQGEILALKYRHLHFERNTISVHSTMKLSGTEQAVARSVSRDVVMTKSVREFLSRRGAQIKEQSHFVLTDDEIGVTSTRALSSIFRKMVKVPLENKDLNFNVLRCTFVRMCLEANINVESVSLITGMDKTLIYRNFGQYIVSDPNAILRLDETKHANVSGVKHLKLLILGAGSHGHTVMETAEKLGVFHEIKFLDDNIEGEDIIGKCEDSNQFVSDFPCAFVAIGNNDSRRYYMGKLRDEGYLIPKIIHPDATVSKNAVIGDGTVVLAQATVDASIIGENCIIASGAMISRGAMISNDVHVDCGGIVMKNAQLPELTTVNSGEVFKDCAG